MRSNGLNRALNRLAQRQAAAGRHRSFEGCSALAQHLLVQGPTFGAIPRRFSELLAESLGGSPESAGTILVFAPGGRYREDSQAEQSEELIPDALSLEDRLAPEAPGSVRVTLVERQLGQILERVGQRPVVANGTCK